MIEYPAMLALIVLVVLTLVFRERKYYLRRGAIFPLAQAVSKHRGRMNFKKILPYFLFVPAIILLIIAAADITAGEQKTFKKYIVHNYVLIDDASGSMVSYATPKGVGRDLRSLIAGNKVFLDTLKSIKREDDSQDAVGLVLFSSDAFIVSYPTVDYNNVYQKLLLVDWQQSPLGQGTDLDKGLWTAIQLVIKRNGESGGSQYLEEELDQLSIRLSGVGRSFVLSDELKKKTEKITKEITGTSFIVFTDGFFDLDSFSNGMSAAKLFVLCKELGIRVYLISVGVSQKEAARFIRETGGEERVISSASDAKSLSKVYQDIAKQQAGEYVFEDKPQKRSYYLWFGVPGLCLLLLWMLVKNTVSRSLTST